MHSSLIKASYVSIKDDKKRVIDSNKIIMERIQAITDSMQTVEDEDNDEYGDDFREGLDAEQVEALFEERDNEEDEEVAQQIETTLSDAKAQAEMIISEAGEEAERIIEDAKVQAEAIMNDAREEGYKSGEEAGYQEGLDKTKALEAELNQKEIEMSRQYEARLSELEPLFVEKLTKIYEHVFHVDLSARSGLILSLIKDAIRNIEGGKNFLVHVSGDDYEYVNGNKATLEECIGSQSSVEIIEDMTLKKNQCFIEAESGIFDCSLDTELELLKNELKLVSYSEE